MPYVVDFQSVSTTGLESSPVADALAGLRANEARYFRNKYNHEFTVEPSAKAKDAVALVNRVLKERNIEIQSPPLQATSFQVDNIRWTYVFYQSGLSINVLYTLDGPAPKRAVGFKLAEGMDVPEELSAFKFARQKSKLAGTIRGSYFVLKGEYF
ncbi:MAG: phage tail protein [Acidimicrobiales bacterium]